MDTWRTGCTPWACQGRDEPVAVEICPELAALGVADPCQSIRARRRHRLLCRAQIFLPDNEGDHRVGVCGGSRRHYARQHQARRRFTTATDCPGLICSLPLTSTLSACDYPATGRNTRTRQA